MKRLILGLVIALAGCSEDSASPGGCSVSDDGVLLFDPPLTEPGEYEFSFEGDDFAGECSGTLVSDGSENMGCSEDQWSVLQTFTSEDPDPDGDPLAPSETVDPTDILGLYMPNVEEGDVVTVTARRDGIVIAQETVTVYQETVDDELCVEVVRPRGDVPIDVDGLGGAGGSS